MHYLTWSHWSCWGTGVMPFNYVYEEFQLSNWVCYWDFKNLTCTNIIVITPQTQNRQRSTHPVQSLGGSDPRLGTTALTHRRTAELQKELTICQI